MTSAGDLVLRYRLDGGALTTTASLLSLSGLAAGNHTLVVQATDQAGNSGSASYSWTVIVPFVRTVRLPVFARTATTCVCWGELLVRRSFNSTLAAGWPTLM